MGTRGLCRLLLFYLRFPRERNFVAHCLAKWVFENFVFSLVNYQEIRAFVMLFVCKYMLFLPDGKAVMSKEVMEAIDDKNHSVTFKVIGGILMELYKSFKFVVQATPKGEGSLVRWTLEYEKLNVDDPESNTMLEFAIGVTKDIDTHLTQCVCVK
uniref:Bet v I/Major latex protein domain-containing protein n=1 Tax=Quercus lobata TaxID=97700 RepID=A0A7N2LP75_QUELO